MSSSEPKPLTELNPETVKRWREKHMPPLADRPDLKEIDEKFREAQRIREEALRKAEDARRRAEDLRREAEMRRVVPHLFRVPSVSRLVCPECGDPDRRNKMNGKPWCMKCNRPLVPKKIAEKLKKMPKVKVVTEPENVTFKKP